MIAKKACTRCSKSKRRCDRVIPDCGLCARYSTEYSYVSVFCSTDLAFRFGRRCEYEVPATAYVGPTPSRSPRSETFVIPEPITSSHLKNTIIHKLEPQSPESVLSIYHQAVEPWFPILPVPRFRSQLRPTWTETPLDAALLCLSIVLLTTIPVSSGRNEEVAFEFETLYLQTKSSVALAEGLRLNSFPIVQARILTTLFEVNHGFYPAAYISMGATLRAADALELHPGEDTLLPHYTDEAVRHEETVLTWCGILVLDR